MGQILLALSESFNQLVVHLNCIKLIDGDDVVQGWEEAECKLKSVPGGQRLPLESSSAAGREERC